MNWNSVNQDSIEKGEKLWNLENQRRQIYLKL